MAQGASRPREGAVRPQDLPRLEAWSPGVAGEGVFSAEECARLRALATPAKTAEIAAPEQDAGYRDSKVSWIRPGPETAWLFEKLAGVCRQVNAERFKLELLGFTEPLQLAEYGPGGHYDWHLDFGAGRFSIRKLSFIVQLSDPADYEGGAVEVMAANEANSFPRGQGTMILFPSFVLHRVAPVTRGSRCSLVGWIGGPHYR